MCRRGRGDFGGGAAGGGGEGGGGNGLKGSRVNLTREGLIVVNTGGNPRCLRQELFERFKKGNSGSDSIGIGLAIVRQICDLSHFTIDYQYRDGAHVLAVGFGPRGGFKIASKSFAPFT
jgi:hypothetical protein